MRKSKRYIAKHARVLQKPRFMNDPDAWFRRPWGRYLSSLLVAVAAEALLVLFCLYGPIPFFRNLIITSSMTTHSHQYYAYTFYSKETINKVLKANNVEPLQSQTDLGGIKIDSDADEKEITVRSISGNGYKGYVMEIPDPSWVRLGIPQELGVKGQKIPQIIKDYGAIAGINAGGFYDPEGWGNGGTPIGTIIIDGYTIHENYEGYANIIGFNEDDVLVLGRYKNSQLKKLNLRDACEFEPFLIINGEPAKITGDGGWGVAPRTAIGQRKDGTVLFVVIDGRQLRSAGATMKQLQNILIEEGAYNAANLDGGSSTVLYYTEEGGVVNSPSGSDRDGMRFLPNAWLVVDPETYSPPTDRAPHNEE